MTTQTATYDTVVIGAGQAGLATGYYLKQQSRDFVILDAHPRVGDAWRRRWDSLRLFTPAWLDSLPGMRFPARAYHFPNKDEMADYLEAYARQLALPVQTGVRVQRLSRHDGRFVVEAGARRYEADNVIVAMSSYQQPWTPAFARDLDPGIVQLHSAEYRTPSQLQPGAALIVGAGNSGAEIALDVSRGRTTWLSGRDTGRIPFRPEAPVARILFPLVARVLFHRILMVSTPMGRRMRQKYLHKGMALFRTKPADLAAAGVQRVPRTVGVRGGRPVLEDGRVLDVANVVWATGFAPGFDWIDLPVFDEDGPRHHRGVVASQPGLYFVGLRFLSAVSSEQVHGVARDARYVVQAIAARQAARCTAQAGRPHAARA